MRLPQLVAAGLAAALTAALAGCSSGAGPQEPSSSDSATVWAIGDGPDGRPASRAVGRLIADARPDALLYLGDVYGDYAETFLDAYGANLARRTLPTPGNHDWPSQRKQYLDFWEEMTGKPQPTYYARTVAGWQIISLNSEEAVGRQSPQYRWLQRTLDDAPPGTCRLAFWHAARFSAGRHGDEQDMEHIWDALAGKATAVLSGHDHTMQRLAPVDGITQYVSGAGGRNHYELDSSDDRLRFGDSTRDGAPALELSPGLLHFRFVAVDGTVLDSGRQTCDPS